MDRLGEAVDPALLEIALRAENRDEVFRWTCERLFAEGRIGSIDAAFRGLVDREKIMSTAIFPGVAVPHCRCATASGTSLVVARLVKPVDFAARDGQPVGLVFTLIGPPEAADGHVRLLGAVAKLIQDAGRREALLTAATPEDFAGLLSSTP